MAQVKVLFFAALAEAAGQREALVEIEDGEPVGNLSTKLEARFPKLSGIAANVAFAVNAEYVPAGQALKDGDEVALIPPVSGG